MSDARIGDAELLAAHARELKAFAGRELDSLPRVQASLDRTERALQERLRRWQRARDEAQAAVQRLQAELDACLAAKKGGCGGLAAALADAERRLAEAERQVERSEHGIRRFDAAVRDFTPALQRYRGILDRAVPQASQSLSRHHDQARAYLARQAGAGGGGSGAGVLGGAAWGEGNVDARGAGSGGGSAPAGPGGATRLGDSELWVVPLDAIDLSDSHVQSEADFDSVSPATMRAEWHRVQEDLLPVAKGGQDPRSARSGPVADAYFGGNSIKLSVGPDGRLTPNNGAHRLFVARQMGITEVPARLVGPGGTL